MSPPNWLIPDDNVKHFLCRINSPVSDSLSFASPGFVCKESSLARQSIYLLGLDNTASQCKIINPCQDLHGFRVGLTGAMENEKMTDRGPEKLGSGGLRAWMETHQQPRSSVCLLYTAEQRGGLVHLCGAGAGAGEVSAGE